MNPDVPASSTVAVNIHPMLLEVVIAWFRHSDVDAAQAPTEAAGGRARLVRNRHPQSLVVAVENVPRQPAWVAFVSGEQEPKGAVVVVA
jgi:hypothetical protein